MLRPTFGRLRRATGIFRPNSSLPPVCRTCGILLPFTPLPGGLKPGWSYEKMLPMLTAYMGNVRDKGFLRYFELTPSRYRAQLACLDVRTTAPDLASRPAKIDEEFRLEKPV